jgi:hypothetical protein
VLRHSFDAQLFWRKFVFLTRCRFLIASCLLLAGCGGADDGLYDLRGTVTLDGKPVPAGEVILEPDSKEGNKGPSSMAQIKDGKFSLTADQGIVGGKYVVTILAFDGVAFGEATEGKELLKKPYTEKIEFPMEDSTHDFVIERK